MPDPTPLLAAWATRRRAALARQDPVATQRRTLLRLLRRAAATRFGRAHDFAGIRNIAGYQERVPLRSWEALHDEWWAPHFPYLGGVTWPGPIRFFANSSGTTRSSTKRIPISAAMLRANRRAALDVLAWHLAARPDSRILSGAAVFLSGSTALEELAPNIRAGDLSAIAAVERPVWARGRMLPPDGINRVADWDAKMRALAPLVLGHPVSSISGTASWLLLFLELAAEESGHAAPRLHDLFPALELIVHGGVGFAPYRPRFRRWLDGSDAMLREVYAASEGFVAVADRGDGEGLRLLLDRGLFLEFVRPAELGSERPDRRWIANADPGEEYALVLSSNAGLWSYVLGDTVRLISRRPARILVTGRTAWTLSVAGEHLSGAELETALAAAAQFCGRELVEWSAAPLPPDAADPRAGHLFAVELDGAADPDSFARVLDDRLHRGNDDYAAHRAGDAGLRPPAVRLLPAGRFHAWMAARGRLGAQNKVPRVVADAAALQTLLDPP
ncbi:MAG: GH3 auxin-responsive promoter family protein [Gluconacetobacter diazotrophicus]|nr:GH3 auxin-responsive promoter family protein [Gluconacetobacter diazotrophicus]